MRCIWCLLIIYTRPTQYIIFFFFNDTATTEIYTLSLHDALPISQDEAGALRGMPVHQGPLRIGEASRLGEGDRKSTRLNSSHGYISYAGFCLKKKKKEYQYDNQTV